jgi:hypothetical protein
LPIVLCVEQRAHFVDEVGLKLLVHYAARQEKSCEAFR